MLEFLLSFVSSLIFTLNLGQKEKFRTRIKSDDIFFVFTLNLKQK